MNNLTILHAVPTTERVVAFTFDDGPNHIYTSQILDIFRDAGGKATFFMIGSQIEANPEIATRVHEEGHEIANHTFTHPYLTQITTEEARAELIRTADCIRSITGGPVRTFRPPYLDMNDEILALAVDLGYSTIGAVNMETRDWEQPGVDYILEKSRGYVGNGSILLFHDGYGDRSQSIEAVRILVEELMGKGYQFITVSELIALEKKGIGI